jgi:hypothetical protein
VASISAMDGPLVVKGEIKVDGEKYPHLRRALERGRKYLTKKGLIACATGQGTETMNTLEDSMAKKTGAKSVNLRYLRRMPSDISISGCGS